MEREQSILEKPMPFAGTAYKTRQVLILCTGNYYRSRFAEMLFDALAREAGLRWSAFSRGLIVRGSINNAGPVSIHVLNGLAMREIPIGGRIRFPVQVREQDLAEADLVIALRGDEHRLYLERRFPAWADKVEYWHIGDMNVSVASDALAEIEIGIRALIQRLSEFQANGDLQRL